MRSSTCRSLARQRRIADDAAPLNQSERYGAGLKGDAVKAMVSEGVEIISHYHRMTAFRLGGHDTEIYLAKPTLHYEPPRPWPCCVVAHDGIMLALMRRVEATDAAPISIEQIISRRLRLMSMPT